MTGIAFALTGFAVMVTGVVGEMYGKVSRRTAWGLLAIGVMLMFIGVMLAGVLYALLWLAVILTVLATGRYVVRSTVARHARRTASS